MARRNPPQQRGDDVDLLPPRELLQFVPSQPAPIGPHGRPEPWKVQWTAEDFAAWLRARAAWRDTHAEPLPGLMAMERVALTRIGVPQALIDEEKAAPEAPPEWVSRRARREDTAEPTSQHKTSTPQARPLSASHGQPIRRSARTAGSLHPSRFVGWGDVGAHGHADETFWPRP